jgi:hypothetical protein
MVHVKQCVKAVPLLAISFCLAAVGGQTSQVAPTTQPAKAPPSNTPQVSDRERQLEVRVRELEQDNLSLKMQLNEHVQEQIRLSQKVIDLKSKAIPFGWVQHEFNGSEFYTLRLTSHRSGQ